MLTETTVSSLSSHNRLPWRRSLVVPASSYYILAVWAISSIWTLCRPVSDLSAHEVEKREEITFTENNDLEASKRQKSIICLLRISN